jgi:DNA uptake protein ComE-like DNA-binding protein
MPGFWKSLVRRAGETCFFAPPAKGGLGGVSGAQPATSTDKNHPHPNPLPPSTAGEGTRTPRRGSVLVIVLVVVVLLSLAALNYSQLMLTEMEATVMHASDAQARAMSDSAAEYVATILANRTEPGLENLQHNPELFQGINVVLSDSDRGRGRFSILSPVEQDLTAQQVRYGLMDESSRLNLNVLDKLTLDEEQSRTLLMGLPGMTEEIADAIRDWIDVDENARTYGAEAEYYESETSYSAKNGPLETIDELLLVRGVTAELLYGEDANRNGLLDPNENDGDASPPLDNADGTLQLGWISYFTVHSREANLRADGTAKIDLNNGLLTDLYDALEEEFGVEVANFVVAYRLVGRDPAEKPPEDTTGTSATTSTTQGQQQQQQQQAVQGIASAIAGAATSGGAVTRGGMDLSKGAKVKVNTLWDLIDTKQTADINVNGRKTKVPGVWTGSGSELTSLLPTLQDALSISADQFIEGRININQARRELLIGIPGMTEELADSIVGGQSLEAESIQNHNSAGWLYTEGLVDIWTMRELDPYLTGRGDVYRAQILGFYDGGGPVARAEVIIDATQIPPRIVFHRDLNDLGRGYTRAQLLTPATQ